MEIYSKPRSEQTRRYENFRPVVVADSLKKLAGPKTGVITLPLYLDWTPVKNYDLANLAAVMLLYKTVLEEAGSVDDLAKYLNRQLFISLWPNLPISEQVRNSWHNVHPELKKLC
jgi:hypothetical protein